MSLDSQSISYNAYNQNALDVAIEAGKEDVALEISKHNRWRWSCVLLLHLLAKTCINKYTYEKCDIILYYTNCFIIHLIKIQHISPHYIILHDTTPSRSAPLSIYALLLVGFDHVFAEGKSSLVCSCVFHYNWYRFWTETRLIRAHFCINIWDYLSASKLSPKARTTKLFYSNIC